jgi:hypothetical protein
MISNDTKDFNALAELNEVIAFEEKHESDYHKASEFPIELSSIHNYSLGTTYFYVHCGDMELGQYWRSAWKDCWMSKSNCTGIIDEADTDYSAIALITKSWEGVI